MKNKSQGNVNVQINVRVGAYFEQDDGHLHGSLWLIQIVRVEVVKKKIAHFMDSIKIIFLVSGGRGIMPDLPTIYKPMYDLNFGLKYFGETNYGMTET